MNDTAETAEPQAPEPVGCEHLDEPYRKLLDEVQQLRRQRKAALSICRDRYQYGHGLVHLVNVDDIRSALGD